MRLPANAKPTWRRATACSPSCSAAAPDQVAFTDSATRSWLAALDAVPLAAGDRVLVGEVEYGGNAIAAADAGAGGRRLGRGGAQRRRRHVLRRGARGHARRAGEAGLGRAGPDQRRHRRRRAPDQRRRARRERRAGAAGRLPGGRAAGRGRRGAGRRHPHRHRPQVAARARAAPASWWCATGPRRSCGPSSPTCKAAPGPAPTATCCATTRACTSSGSATTPAASA